VDGKGPIGTVSRTDVGAEILEMDAGRGPMSRRAPFASTGGLNATNRGTETSREAKLVMISAMVAALVLCAAALRR
jgi:hypothetical protein